MDLDAFCLRQEEKSLEAALKNEVGLVQGGRQRRRKKSNSKKNDQEVEWSAESYHPEEDSSTRVIKMECKIPSRKKKERNSEGKLKKTIPNITRNETRRILTGFCFENGLSFYFPLKLDEESSPVTNFSSWTKYFPRRTKPQAKKLFQKRKNRLLTRRLRGGTGGGGGQHPSISTPNEKHSTGAGTGAGTGLVPTHPHFEKTLSSIFNAPTPTHGETLKRTVSIHQAPEDDDHDHEGAAHKKSRMSLGIRHYTMSGKMKTHRLSLDDNLFHQPGKSHRESASASTTLTLSSTSSSLKSARRVRMASESHDQHGHHHSILKRPEKTSLTPAMEGRSRKSLAIGGTSLSLSVASGFKGNLISSVSQIRASSGAFERDTEWLQWTSSDDDQLEDKDSSQKQPRSKISMLINSDAKKETENLIPKSEIKTKGEKKTKTIQAELKPFLDSIKGLEKLGFWLGLNPYQKVVRGNGSVQVKWVPKSWRFAAVGLNAFFFLALTLSSSSTLIYIYSIKEPLPVSLAILKIDFANHFAETLFLILIALFLLIHCVSSMLEQGFHFAEFMGRFNTVVSFTRYDVSEGIHEMIKRQMSVAAIVSFFCIFIFFSRAKYADFREDSGFVGLTILYPLNLEIRQSIYFPFVEILGLLVFLHCFIGVNVVLLQFLVYAKALANMAKIFNLRLIYVLGDTSIQTTDGRWSPIRKHIPFDKLQAEHQMIVSLVRHLSHVSILYIYSFMMSIVLELALGIWLLFDMFLSTQYHPNVEGVFITEKDTVELAVPMRVTNLEDEWIVSSFAMIGITWLTYWLFGGVVHHAGEYLNAASDYVRRHGLISCGSSKERRFILSIINSCASRGGHWIGRNFNFNRAFLVSLLGLIIGCSMVTVTFRPDRLKLNSYEICNADGVCTQIWASKFAEAQVYKFYQPPQLPLPQYPSAYYNGTLPPLNVSERYFAPDILLDYPHCSSFGSYPNTESDSSVVCPASWEGNRNLTEIKLPLVYKYMFIKFPLVSAQFNFYGVIRDLFYSMESGTSKCRTRDFPFYNFPYTDAFGVPPSTPPTDCFGSVLDVKIKDDCGNFPSSTINAKTEKNVEAKLKPVYVPNLSGLESVEESLVCCYEYGGFAGSEAQAEVCNMANPPTFEVACETGPGRRRLKPAHIKEYYRKLLVRLRYQDHIRMGSSLEYIRKNYETIRDCFCKLDEPEISLKSQEYCACVGLQLPPCLPGYFNEKEEDYTLSCGAVKAPLLFKMNSDFTLVFPGEHVRYKDVCVGDKFNDTFSHNDALDYDYPCELPIPRPPDPIHLMDCAGNPILKVEKDDCSNWNVMTPDHTNEGQMLPTSLRLKVVNYNLAKKEFVSTEEENRAFVCCFEYQGQAFQSSHQVKYCNVPSAKAMNNDGWCGAVARNNGIRNSAPFDKKLHAQLHRKLEITVRYHEVKGRPDWILEKNEVWKRCMCTNMIDGANQTSYSDWVQDCIPLIVPPADADKANVFRSVIQCPHEWPSSYPHKEIKTPLIFTIENDIWESHDRYRKTSDLKVTSQCHLNEDYEEVYKNNGNPIIYDVSLNSLPLGETDDCWNLPQRTFVSSTGTSLKSPEIRLSPEYTMARYDANAFKESSSVHCCYSFSNFPSEQRLICSLPNAASVKNRCKGKPKSARRLEHEYQLTRRLAVFENGANFIGDRVIHSDYSLTLDSPLEKIWRKCICEANSSSDSTHNKCKKEYLPPCIISKGTGAPNITKIDQIFTPCPAQWNGGPSTINLPIIMEETSDGTLVQLPLYLEGSNPKHCPSPSTAPIGSQTSLTDCYGQTLKPTLDDCKNPFTFTPNPKNLTQRQKPIAELIPANHLPNLGSSEEFFCCFKYGISTTSDLKVCHQPDDTSVAKNCEFKRDALFTPFVEKLRKRRRRGLDALTPTTLFNSPARVAWTQCLCNGNQDECQRAVNLQTHPCIKSPYVQFNKCKLSKEPPWNHVDRKHNSYPILLEKIDDTDYRQIMLLGEGRCEQVGNDPPFPTDTIYSLPQPPWYTCKKKEYPKFYLDDCGTPIFPLDSNVKRLDIRVSAAVFKTSRVAKCIVEYKYGNQAQYFNMPSQEDFNRKCTGGPVNYYNFYDVYNTIRPSDKPNRMEIHPKTVNCLCYHLEYVRDRHFSHPLSEVECRSHFKTFCKPPGSC